MLIASFGASVAGAQSPTIAQLIVAERYDEARTVLNQTGATPLDIAVAEALIARQQGRTGEAIARLRAILRARPDLLPVRRLLANFLAESAQYEAAEFQFRRLLEEDPNPDNRAAYNRALRRISGLKPFGFGGSVALVPSTNINRGTTTEVFPTDFGDFVIDDDNLGTTGIGLAVNASAFRRFDLASGRRLRFDAIVGAIVYDAAQFNQHSFTLRSTLSATEGGEGWAVAPEYTRAYVAGTLSFDRYAVSISRATTLDQDTALRFRGVAEHRDYQADTFLTGERYELQATLRRRLDPRTALEGDVAYKLAETQSASFQYDGVEVGARLTRAFANGLQLGLGASHEWRPYRGDFTGVSFPRNDNVTSLDVSLFSDRWTIDGAAPTYSCRLTWAQSNIAFYDYDVQECSIGFTRAF